MELKGCIKKILVQKEDDWGKFLVLDDMGKENTVVGVIPHAFTGMNIVITGDFINNKYGNQFKLSNIVRADEDSFAGIKRFLTDGYVKGIGYKKALEIVDKFGDRSLDLFETEEGQKELLTIKGIGPSVLSKALSSYKKSKKYRDIVVFLHGAGTQNQVQNIYDKYGKETIDILKENPYRLQMDLDGFGFKKTDAIALNSGIKHNSVYRVMAGIKYLIDEAQNDGHCYLTEEEIRPEITKLLCPMPTFEDLTEKIAENAAKDWGENKQKLIDRYKPSSETVNTIEQVVDARRSIEDVYFLAINKAIADGDFVDFNGCIYTKNMYNTELWVARKINELLKQGPVRQVSPQTIQRAISEVEKRKTQELKAMGDDKDFVTTDEQKEAINIALKNRVSIISGGPGRGKTTISEVVVHAFLLSGAFYKTSDILMIAPTGKAAKRISESTGYDAMTVHRAILKNEKPVNKLVLIDESSMIDIRLMKRVLDFAQYSNIVIVGDIYQIASIGPGKVLKDMIESEQIPYIILKKGHRNSGNISHNAEKINNGVYKSYYDYGSDFVYIPYRTYSPDEVIDPAILERNPNIHQDTADLADKIVNDYILKVRQYGYKDVMLCAAMRERGNTSVKKLNLKLQQVMTHGRPEADFGPKGKYRVGDRVMQIRNNYDFVLICPDKSQVKGVFNGDMGVVCKINRLPDNDYSVIVLFDDGNYGRYTKETISDITLAYAITLHKCQGSESKCMMMVYTYADYMLLNRSLFYTGETRAKKEFRFYGEERFNHGRWCSAFDIAVRNAQDIKRNTNLCSFLKDTA